MIIMIICVHSLKSPIKKDFSMNLMILSASVREGRNSHRVALFFQQFLQTFPTAAGPDPSSGTAVQPAQTLQVQIVDLMDYDFPVFHERLKYQKTPTPQMLDFSSKVKEADGVIIVTPEYNGGYPASLKNVVDLLYEEWKRKPVALVTVSDGAFGGAQVTTSLVFSLWKIGAWVVPAMFPVPSVKTSYDETGHPADPEKTNHRATHFINELLWCIEARKRMTGPSGF
jgi:NAD(P)H-dependent FMN reductase